MTDRPRLREINHLLFHLVRSLLQYVGEAWPWSPEDEGEAQETVDKLVARQSAAVGRITEFLDDRNWPVDFGTYPAEYTDLHYVSLDFLLKQLIRNADETVAAVADVYHRCEEDSPEAELLDGVLRDQQYIANMLRDLSESTSREEPVGSTAE